MQVGGLDHADDIVDVVLEGDRRRRLVPTIPGTAQGHRHDPATRSVESIEQRLPRPRPDPRAVDEHDRPTRRRRRGRCGTVRFGNAGRCRAIVHR
ncbi:MAG: hypothetical protein R2705_23985 [Ilumatobacteraceae bacterium]